MKATTLLFVVILSARLSRATSGSMRNLSEIRYHFTTCGQRGSAGPEYEQCLDEYSRMKSPITDEGLLVNLESLQRGSDYYQGAQRFKVPRTGFYNVTVAGAAGGRGVCSTTLGRGLLWTGTVLLHEEQDLLILVGQQGLGPCDEEVTLERPLPLCSNPPANLSDVQSCQTEWTSWINSDPMLPETERPFVQAIIGGGSGGGASFILPVFRANESFNRYPIVIAPGGAGSAAEERQEIFEEIDKPSPTNVSSEEQLLLLINGQTSSYPSYDMFVRGSRGFINESVSSATTRPGAGGGWGAGSSASTLSEGHAIGIESQFALGGQDCAIRLRGSFTPYVPVLNVNGGFGGGGSQCAGGGAGGGYTGGSIVFSRFYIPGGGGYFLGPEEAGYDTNNFIKNSLELNSAQLDGFVKIIPMDCGCSYDCNVYDETFECVCPTGFNLTPNQVDCFQGSVVNVSQLSSRRQGDFTITPMVLDNSITVFGMSAVLVNPDGISDDWSCSIFLLGKNNDIVAVTQPVRESRAVANYLAAVNSSNVDTYQSQLTTPVTVTGALLVSISGGCSLEGTTLAVNLSMLEANSSALGQQFFSGYDYSSAQSVAEFVLVDSTSIPVTTTSTPMQSPQTVIIIAVLVVVIALVLMVTVAVLGFLLYRRIRDQKGGMEAFDSVHPKRKHNDYSANAYDGKKFMASPPRQEINILYEAGPPSHASLDGEFGYESISYNDADGMKRLSMKRRTSINASARFFSPRHGISAPEHDFTPFNLQRSQYREWEYPRKNLIYLKELGEGEFGKVLLMKAQGIADFKGEIPVAVKTLSFKNQHLLDKFMEEINLMKKFAHPNIVGLLGTSTKDISVDSAPLMILEYMPFGDLHTFLSKHKPSIHIPRKSQRRIGPAHFFSFSKDVAEAMAFLASQKHVHRDIAARNCLVGTGLQVKIADFGMARAVASSDKEIYKVEGKAVLPIRWLAPESLLYGIFSTASDVWSYGVLLWEIVTFGELPLTDMKTNQIIEMAQTEDLIHPRPRNCPDEIADVMSRCHMHKRNERITFEQIVEEFSKEDILKLMGEKEIEISGVY